MHRFRLAIPALALMLLPLPCRCRSHMAQRCVPLESFHLIHALRSVRFATFANYTTVSNAAFLVPGSHSDAIPDLAFFVV